MTDYYTGRVVLVGDAAHIFQPHTGQGVSQAVEDAACLTQQLRPFALARDIKMNNLKTALSLYQSKRRPRV
jgi:salicylate hydroxylase